MASRADQRIVTLAGARVVCREAGAGEPVLLLHGYPQSHHCWRGQFEQLATTHRVIAPDWLGWGDSERSLRLAPEYGAEVQRIGLLADALGLGDFNLFAHDYGGFLGLGFVIRQPRRVRRFAILNSRAHRSFTPAFYRQMALQCFMARRPLLRGLLGALPVAAMHRRVLRRYVHMNCFTAAELDRYVGWMDTPEGRRWWVHFFAHYEVPPRPELTAGLATIRCPAAVIWGARDPYLSPAIAEELVAGIAGARLTLLADADHYVMEEKPAEVLAALRDLLRRPV